MASGGRLNVASRWDNEPKNVLVDRIKMLEEELRLVKQRMDELRKAKNQTIIKREHEFVEMGNPISQKDIQVAARCRELEEKIANIRREHSNQVAHLREEKDREITMLNDTLINARNEVQQGPCGHEEELRELRARVTSLENEAENVKTDNEVQKDTIDGLWNQLSVKEAEWCDKEERQLFQFQKTLQTIQEGMSEKVARQIQARIEEVWNNGEPNEEEEEKVDDKDKGKKSSGK